MPGSSKNNYLAFVDSGIKHQGVNPEEDGRKLAHGCSQKLEKLDPDHFPARLLVLFTSPEYLDQQKAQRLVKAIYERFEGKVPLIGTSAAAIAWGGTVLAEGAVLVCLASELLEATVAVGEDARSQAPEAISGLCDQLHLGKGEGKELNPFGTRYLLTFLPGYGHEEEADHYVAADIYELLREGVQARVPIVGGATSAGPEWRGKKAAFQYCNDGVYTDAAVAACLDSSLPIAIGCGDGLTETERFLRVKKVSNDGLTIEEVWEEGTPKEVIGELKEEPDEFVLLKDLTANPDAIVVKPEIVDGTGHIRLRRTATSHSVFQLLRPEPDTMLKTCSELVLGMKERMHIRKPAAALVFVCSARLQESDHIRLEVGRAYREAKENLGDGVCVGAYLDGEIGTDRRGKRVFTNWSISGMMLGDEWRRRGSLQAGWRLLIMDVKPDEAGPQPPDGENGTLDDAVSYGVELIREARLPGGMISLRFDEKDEPWYVAVGAVGGKFECIKEDTKRPDHKNDILSIVARNKRAEFVRDSEDPRCDADAIRNSGLISQYVAPLLSTDGETIGVLQIDLGNRREPRHEGRADEFFQQEKALLDLIAHRVACRIDGCMRAERLRIRKKVHDAIWRATMAETEAEGLALLIDAVTNGLDAIIGWHVRYLSEDEERLDLIAGYGPYYEIARKRRLCISVDDEFATATTFKKGKTTIVQDCAPSQHGAAPDACHDEICKCFKGEELGERLAEIKSYADIVFECGNKKVGIISIAAQKPWFFRASLMEALEVLREDLGLLYQHFRERERTEEAARSLGFLRDVGLKLWHDAAPQRHKGEHEQEVPPASAPDLALRLGIEHARATLRHGIESICQVTGAEVASLYLREEGTDTFVLRAQAKWQSPDALDVACYSKDEGIMGFALTLDEAKYEPHLDEGVKDEYLEEMFGAMPPRMENIEAIIVPLRLEGEAFGALFLYRCLKREGAFTTVKEKDLREFRHDVSAFTKIARDRAAAAWEHLTHQQRIDVFKIFLQERIALRGKASVIPLHKGICQQVLHSCGADEVVFYLHPLTVRRIERAFGEETPSEEQGLGIQPLLPIAEFHRDPQANEGYFVEGAECRVADETVWELLERQEEDVVLWTLAEEDGSQNVAAVQMKGHMVTRACIPLAARSHKLGPDESVIGVLDVRRRPKGPSNLGFSRERFNEHMIRLGGGIGDGYYKHLLAAVTLAKEKERAGQRSLAQAAGAMLGQGGHILGHMSDDIKRLQNAETGTLDDLVAEIAKALPNIRERHEWFSEVGKAIEESNPSPVSVLQLIEETGLLEGAFFGKGKGVSLALDRSALLEMRVDVVGVCIREAFRCILENIVKEGGFRRDTTKEFGVAISAARETNGPFVSVVFSDSGKGMQKETWLEARAGKARDARGRRRLGLYLTERLVRSQGGRLEISSRTSSDVENPGETGTTVTIQLPAET